MSLKKIADVKQRKRRFSTGEGVYEGDGYAGVEAGMGGGAGSEADTNGRPGGGDVEEGSYADIGAEYGVPGPSTGVYGGSVQYQGENLPGGAQRTGIGQMMDRLEGLSTGQKAALGAAPFGALGMTALGLANKAGLGWTGGNNVRGADATEVAAEHNQHEAGANAATQPFGSETPAQTTPIAAGGTGMRRYIWNPQTRQYTLAEVGGGANPMGYTQGQTFNMGPAGSAPASALDAAAIEKSIGHIGRGYWAAGGPAPAGISAGAPRFMRGGGTGLSDSIPVQMDDGGEGRLADGEFVIPSDVVSGLGGGSSEAGARELYAMMERIRQQAHGKSQQIRPVDPQQVLPA